MNRFGNFHTAFRAGRFIAVAFLFSAVALAGYLTSANAQSRSVWKLKEVRYVPNLYGNLGEVTLERHDSKGGEVEILVSGNASGLCPGGSEKLRFTWRFTGDISQVASGGTVGVNLEAVQLARRQPCGAALAASSYIGLYGSEGYGGAIFPAEDGNRIDGDRFNNEYKQPKAVPDPNGQQTASGGVNVKTHEPYPTRPLAYFDVRVQTPGGYLNFIHLYELSDGKGAAAGGGGGGGNGGGNKGSAGLGGESMKACDFYLGGGLYNKWVQTGGESGVLGCPIMSEADSAKSPQGTTGRYAEFGGGLIVWHRVGPYRGTSFSVDGCFFKIYKSVGRTGSWLGLPVGDAFNIGGGSRQDFEGGYMQWSSQTGKCQAYKK